MTRRQGLTPDSTRPFAVSAHAPGPSPRDRSDKWHLGVCTRTGRDDGLPNFIPNE
jgi:hypothetical protein